MNETKLRKRKRKVETRRGKIVGKFKNMRTKKNNGRFILHLTIGGGERNKSEQEKLNRKITKGDSTRKGNKRERTPISRGRKRNAH